MQFLIGYAGIPSVIFDQILVQEIANICGSNCQFLAFPLQSKNGEVRYTERDANKFLSEFAKRLKQDHENKLANTGFAMIYVDHQAASTMRFAESFFPAMLTVPIGWKLEEGDQKAMRTSARALGQLLRKATNQVKAVIPVIKKEVTEADSRTPLLLPVRNFKSKLLTASLKDLQTALLNATDITAAIRKAINGLMHIHPPQISAFPRYQRDCFIDERSIEFNPPGKARHGFPRGGASHSDSCYISGHRRLGAPYDHAFHYDCVRGSGNLKDEFFGCHAQETMIEGHPHLNIYPNDFVRK